MVGPVCIPKDCVNICKKHGKTSGACGYCSINYPCEPQDYQEAPPGWNPGYEKKPIPLKPNPLPPPLAPSPFLPPGGEGAVHPKPHPPPPPSETPPWSQPTEPPPPGGFPPIFDPPKDEPPVQPIPTQPPPVQPIPTQPPPVQPPSVQPPPAADVPAPGEPSPVFPRLPIPEEGEQRNYLPSMPNESLPNFGLPLVCFAEERSGRVVYGCYDERGYRFEYRGPAHPNSTSTIFGNWTGPAPYANDLPAKVKARVGVETSALDSFSLLYTTLCYDYGYHVIEINTEYVARIQKAIDRGVISATRNTSEFFAAMKILRSFQRTQHVFDAVSAFGKTDYSTRLAAVPVSSRFMDVNAEMTFPAFDLTEDQLEKCQQAFYANSQVNVTNMDELLQFMESAGLSASYPYMWLSQRRFSQIQSDYAFQYIQDQLQTMIRSSEVLPAWTTRKKNDPFKQLQSAVSLRALTTDLTAAVVETLL